MNGVKNNSRGVTLIALTVAVIILIILSTILIYNAKNGIKMRNLKMLQNDIEVLDGQIDAYYVKYGAIPAEIEYTNEENIAMFKQKNDGDKYYEIDLSVLEGITLNYGAKKDNDGNEDKEDVYIINMQSHHIYYAKGIQVDGKIYFTNDEDEKIEN